MCKGKIIYEHTWNRKNNKINHVDYYIIILGRHWFVFLFKHYQIIQLLNFSVDLFYIITSYNKNSSREHA